MNHPLDHDRRSFLRHTACGLGSIALGSLLNEDALASPLAPRHGHFAPKAKRVIFLFMAGAPSQLDLFEPKPVMRRYHGQPVPSSYLAGLDDALIKGSARVFASPRKFKKHGDGGLPFSDYLPNMAKRADDFCMIRSMYTDVSNHHPAQLLANCGVPRFGMPSMGSWVTYGLGSESKNLPAFIVMLSRAGPGDLGGSALWGNAFLPAVTRGTTLRSQGDPILHLSNPKGINSEEQSLRLKAIVTLNRVRQRKQLDPEIEARIANYELAHRMQTAAPELVDLSQETKKTLDLYGIGDKKKSNAFGRNCLLARRLVERGTRFVQLYHYTWDDHSGLNERLKNNCQMTEQGVAALLLDLKQRGLLDETLVVWGGEFGRTPMNEVRRGTRPGYEGRDHHPFGFTMLMAGGGVRGGQIIGKTDDLGYHAVEDRMNMHDLQATILHLLGLDHEKLTFRHQGRDHRLTDVAGEVMHKVMG